MRRHAIILYILGFALILRVDAQLSPNETSLPVSADPQSIRDCLRSRARFAGFEIRTVTLNGTVSSWSGQHVSGNIGLAQSGPYSAHVSVTLPGARYEVATEAGRARVRKEAGRARVRKADGSIQEVGGDFALTGVDIFPLVWLSATLARPQTSLQIMPADPNESSLIHVRILADSLPESTREIVTHHGARTSSSTDFLTKDVFIDNQCNVTRVDTNVPPVSGNVILRRSTRLSAYASESGLDVPHHIVQLLNGMVANTIDVSSYVFNPAISIRATDLREDTSK